MFVHHGSLLSVVIAGGRNPKAPREGARLALQTQFLKRNIHKSGRRDYRPHAAAKPKEMNRNVGTESARVSETTRSAPCSLPLCWRTRYCCFIHSILVLQSPSGYRQYGQSYPCTSSMARKRRSSGPRQSRDFAAICWSPHN